MSEVTEIFNALTGHGAAHILKVRDYADRITRLKGAKLSKADLDLLDAIGVEMRAANRYLGYALLRAGVRNSNIEEAR